MPSLSIVIPIHNEEKALGTFMPRVIAACKSLQTQTDLSPIEIIAVNDGSTDRSEEILKQYPGVRIINHPNNLGYGMALKTGFVNATGDLISFFDADVTYPPEYLTQLYQAYQKEDSDIVVGSRLLSKKQAGFNPVRYIGNLFFALLGSAATGKTISDSASGMRLFKACFVDFFLYLPDGLDFTLAMTVKALNSGMKISEVQIPYAARLGESKLNAVNDGIRFLRTVAFLTFLGKPFRIFIVISFVFLLISLALGIRPVLFYLDTHTVPEFFVYRIMAILVFLTVGVNCLMIGVFSQSMLAMRKIRRFFFAIVLGAALIVAGLFLNLGGAAEYLRFRSVSTPWVYPAAGAILILTGAQICLSGILFRILSKIERHNYYRAQRQSGKIP